MNLLLVLSVLLLVLSANVNANDPATDSPTVTSAPTHTEAPTITAAPSISLAPVVPSSSPTSINDVICQDEDACEELAMEPDMEKRKQLCGELKKNCPVACGDEKCYDYFGNCKDQEGYFWNLGDTGKSCKIVNWMRTHDKFGNEGQNEWYEPICQSTSREIIGGEFDPVEKAWVNGTTDDTDYSTLVQDRCPVACHNTDCTCNDSKISFVTEPTINTDTDEQIEGITKRTCDDIYTLPNSLYRNVVCQADILADVKSKPVYMLCPKACGFRTECFCKDSKKIVHTPERVKQPTRYCKNARYYPDDGKSFMCNAKKNPTFSRSCPIQCENKWCEGKDTKGSISLYNGKISTSCWLIENGPDDYKDYACNAFDDNTWLTGHQLCPTSCEGQEVKEF